jgi:hypothetical protein
MIASLILAALISSPSIGEIYTLPTWMPRSVDARHTPGSYPATDYPARVTAETWAAYAAIDEAILERAYYLCAANGRGNIYAPGLDDFDPRNVWYGIYPSYDRRVWVVTNLVKSASTRILRPDARVWATNLWGAMSYYGFNGDLRFLSFTFRDADHTYLNDIRPSVYPSSSLIGDATPAFPTWQWTASTNELEGVIGQWYNRGVTFYNFASDSLAPWYGDRDIYPRVMPGLDGIGVTNVFLITNEFTVSGLLTNNFTVVNYLMATNTSTRLLWERAAAASELLAAVDRSYSDESGTIWITNSTYTVTAEKRYEASMDTSGLNLDRWGNLYGYTQHPALSWQVVSNGLEAVTNQYRGTHLELAVSRDIPSTLAGPKGPGGYGAWRLGVESLLNDVHVPSDYSGDVRFEVKNCEHASTDWRIMNFDVVATALSTNWTNSYQEDVGADLNPPATITFVCRGKLQSEWTEALTLPSVPDLRAMGALAYPCWRAFTTRRVREVELAILARFYDYDEQWVPLADEWRCASTTYANETTGLSWLHSELKEYVDKLKDNLVAHGITEMPSVAGVSQRLDGAIAECGANVTLTCNDWILPETNLWFDVTYSGGRPVNYPDWFQIGGLNLGATIDIVMPTSTTNLITKSVRGIITDQKQFYRVDWNWHALHLDRDDHNH